MTECCDISQSSRALRCCAASRRHGPSRDSRREGRSRGFSHFAPPQPGEILSGFLQDVLKLSAEQKKELGDLQKDVSTKLNKILTADQKKSLENMRPGKGGFGPPGFGPPGGGGPTPPGGTPGGVPPKMGFGGGNPFGGFKTDDTQKKIGATDEEWKVIGPKVQKVRRSAPSDQRRRRRFRRARGKWRSRPRPGGPQGCPG